MRVLAHLKDFDFSALKLDVAGCHFFLRHNFDRNIFSGLFMNRGFHKSKLSFSKGVFDVVEVE